jgi:hypothetical protein
MARAKVKPTKPTSRPSRQRSIPAGREEQSSRKRGAKTKLENPRKRSRRGRARLPGGTPRSLSLR